MPTVGLAMIARDEEHRLPCLLDSYGEAFDETVLVDTGSTDGTEAASASKLSGSRERVPGTREVASMRLCAHPHTGGSTMPGQSRALRIGLTISCPLSPSPA